MLKYSKNSIKTARVSRLFLYLWLWCKPILEKSSNDPNKSYQLFTRITYNSYFRKYLKIWCQWLQGRHLSWGPTSANLGAVGQQLFQKNFTTVLFGVWQIFSELTKNNTWSIAQKILSKKVKWVLCRRGAGTIVAMELQKKRKWTITKTLLQTFLQYSELVFSQWCFDGHLSAVVAVTFKKGNWV